MKCKLIFATLLASYAILNVQVYAQNLSEGIKVQGEIVAAHTAEISPRFDGLLEKIHFYPGQFVEKGQLLFEFSPTEKLLLLDIASARLKRAVAQLRLAELKLKNQRSLLKKDVTSELQALEAEAGRDVAAANEAEAAASVRVAELTLKEMKLFAPFSGIISHEFVSEGAYITKVARDQSKMAIVTQLNPIRVICEVGFDAFSEILEIKRTDDKSREHIELTLFTPDGKRFPHLGKVVGGGDQFNRETQKIQTLAEFPNPSYLLRPGLRVTIEARIAGVR